MPNKEAFIITYDIIKAIRIETLLLKYITHITSNTLKNCYTNENIENVKIFQILFIVHVNKH